MIFLTVVAPKNQLHLLEPEFMGVSVDFYCVSHGEFAGQKLSRKAILQTLLNCPLQRPCTEDGVIALIHNLLTGTVGEFNPNLALFQTLGEVIELDIDNLS